MISARRGAGTRLHFFEGGVSGFDGEVDFHGTGALEDADELAGVGRIAILAGVAGAGWNPLSINEVAEGLGFGSSGSHGSNSPGTI